MDKAVGGVILEASVRTSQGKTAAGVLRREGLIPGVIYGEEAAAISIQVAARDLNRVLHTKAGGNVLITLHLKEDSPPQRSAGPPSSVADKKLPESTVLIKELQHHPVLHQIIHVDFHRISLTKRITVTVPLAFKGEAVGVKTAGGILEHLRWDLEVECLPTQIPAQIPMDVSSLELGKTLFAKDVPLLEGVRLVTDSGLPVVACVMPKEEKIPVAGAPEAATEVSEPEVIKQKKPEEIAAEEEAQAKEKEKEGKKG